MLTAKKALSWIVAPFRAPSIAEIVKMELEHEKKILADCQHTIKTAHFQMTLTQAKIAALQQWKDPYG